MRVIIVLSQGKFDAHIHETGLTFGVVVTCGGRGAGIAASALEFERVVLEATAQ